MWTPCAPNWTEKSKNWQDYATRVLQNAWDMDAADDVVATGSDNLTGVDYNAPGFPGMLTAQNTNSDVMLIDMGYLHVIARAGGVQISTSLHISFDADAMAFRATWRLDAQPRITMPPRTWSSPSGASRSSVPGSAVPIEPILIRPGGLRVPTAGQ